MGHDNITCFLHPITPHGIHISEIASLSVGKGPSADLHLHLGPRHPRSFTHGHSGQHLSSTYFLCFWSCPLQILLDLFLFSVRLLTHVHLCFQFSECIQKSVWLFSIAVITYNPQCLRTAPIYSLPGLQVGSPGWYGWFSAWCFPRLKSKFPPAVISPGTWGPLLSSFLLAGFGSSWL